MDNFVRCCDFSRHVVVFQVNIMKDKKEKKFKSHDRVVKPSKNLDFCSLLPAIVDGKLVITNELLVLNRSWRKTSDDRITFCKLLRVKGDDVTLSDETLGQEFTFSLLKDTSVHDLLRIYSKPQKRSNEPMTQEQKKMRKLEKKILRELKKKVCDAGELIWKLSNGNEANISDVRAAMLYLNERGIVEFDDVGNVRWAGSGFELCIKKQSDGSFETNVVRSSNEIDDDITVNEKADVGTSVDDEASDS